MGWSEGAGGRFGWDDLSDDLLHLLDALGLDRVRLVGHDWGSLIGYRTAIRHPERLERPRGHRRHPSVAGAQHDLDQLAPARGTSGRSP